MGKKLHVVHGQRDELHAEGRKALFQFAITGNPEKLNKVVEIDKRLRRRGALFVVKKDLPIGLSE